MFHPLSSMSRHESDMASRSFRQLQDLEPGADPVERLRLLCLSWGATGILGLGRMFRRMDYDGKKQLTEKQYLAGLRKTGMNVTHVEAMAMFNKFNTGNHGHINMKDFLTAIRPPMSNTRKNILGVAFKKIDKTEDGAITLDGLRNVYNVKRHPLYITGVESEETIVDRFLANFEKEATKDGHVTHEEFLNFYSAISVSIDQDGYFDLMMRQCYKL